MIGPVLLTGADLNSENLNRLRSDKPRLHDIYAGQLEELYRVTYPMQNPEKTLEEFLSAKGTGEFDGAWVYFPWSHQLIHCVEADDLYRLRTNRNKLLITDEEQKKLRDTVVGVAGMSVGAGMAIGMAYSGISRTIKLADFDIVDTTNLNRLKEPLSSVGQPKIHAAARRIYELDPFSTVHCFESGLSEANIGEFLTDPAVSVVIDEIDDFKMKVLLRVHAKKHRIPLLMFTSLGDNILVDVERYDERPELSIFNGLLGELTDDIISKPEINPDDARRLAVQIVGQEYVPTRALASLREMGRTLTGRPQLYSTIAVDGGLAAYVVRRIILDGLPESGRYFIKFSELFGLEDSDLRNTPERDRLLKDVLS
jgi:molybdopterin/thiamine biosynthesis adenylyltransferase